MSLRYEAKTQEVFCDVCINKGIARAINLSRAIPAYVSEWIISRTASHGEIDESAQQKIHEFIQRHLPPKDQKERLKAKLLQGEALLILDEYRVEVNLRTSDLILKVPCLDEMRAGIHKHIVETYPLLLGSGVWGVGKLEYEPPDEEQHPIGRVYMVDFRPMQAASIDLDLFCDQRSYFELDEWRDLLISSMGYNPEFYSPYEQMLILTRLLPVVQERINLIELAPKGTGKSFVFINLSRHIRLVSGGKVTAAVLFYNNATNQPGLLNQFDVVVFDEGQTLSFDNPGEVVGVLKDYLESGRFSRGGKQQVAATASTVILANIPLDRDKKPRTENLFLNLPPFLGETAFIDRIHGILPGWDLPRIQQETISKNIGFKADFFGEVLHELRHRSGYAEYVDAHTTLLGTNDIRDRNAIYRLAAGYLKLLFPDLRLTHQEFVDYCLRPAVKLRQLVRDQLSIIDPEYPKISIDVP